MEKTAYMTDKNETLPEKEMFQQEENTNDFRQRLLRELDDASPLDAFSILEQVEMYDESDARQVIDDVYREFESGENQVENVVVPVFTSVIDGLLQSLGDDKAGVIGKSKDLGLSATRIVQECRNFRYGTSDVNSQIYSEVEKNAVILNAEHDVNRVMTEKGHNSVHNYYRQKKTADAHGDAYYNYSFTSKQQQEARERARNKDGKLQDAYSGEILYENQKEAREANDPGRSPEVDHVVPLERVHKQLRENCLLTDDDVREIANLDENLVVTARSINNPKRSKTNSEYVEENKEELNRETRRKMVQMEKRAQRKINNAANKAVIGNMLDPEKNEAFRKEMGNVAKDAAKNGAKLGIGNAIIELLKPLYYEMADSFKNGFVEGVGAHKIGEAFKIRMGRIGKHLKTELKNLGLGSLTDLIKGLISSVVGAIVDMFFGIVKDLLKLLRRGIPIVISAFKVLFDKTKSPAERGDALVKLVGSSLIAILGGLLIDKLFPSEQTGFMAVLKSVCTCLISGCGSLFFMLFLDKIDLFSVKAEKRQERIREIFAERRKELQKRAECMRVDVIDALKNQRLQFDDLISGAEKAIAEKDVDSVNQYSYALADFFGVKLEYSNTEEFVEWWDRQQTVRI